MDRFNEIDGTVLLCNAGTFTVAQLYEHRREIFAKRGQGYVRLHQHGATSMRTVFWDALDLEKSVHFPMARMTLQPQVIAKVRPKKKAA